MATDNENYLGHYAGFTSRLIAYAIDLLMPVVGMAIIWWLIRASIDVLNVGIWVDMSSWSEAFYQIIYPIDAVILRGLILFLGVWGYHVFFLALTNRTIGKAIMGLQVVPLSGGRIGVIRASVRFLGYIISIIPFFFGFIWILFSRKRQGWHDKLARTCVVYSWEAKPDEVFLRRQVQRLQKANEKRFGSPSE